MSERVYKTCGSEQARVLSVLEAAEILGISRNGCYEAIRRGEIPHLRIGSKIRIPRAGIEKLLGERE